MCGWMVVWEGLSDVWVDSSVGGLSDVWVDSGVWVIVVWEG